MLVGIDFGTSNSACSILLPNGRVEDVELEPGTKNSLLMPSYWYYTDNGFSIGTEAKKLYIENDYLGYFFVSLKSVLSNTKLQAININDRFIKIEEIIAQLLIKIREKIEAKYGQITAVNAGRPVILSDDSSKEKDVEERLRKVYKIAGFPEPNFILEPIAAAFHYLQSLEQKKLALVADFGGGTLDYSLLKLHPTSSSDKSKILNSHGVRIGGDNITAILMRFFYPFFGENSQIRSADRQKWLPFPAQYLNNISDWKNIWRIQALAHEIKKTIKWGSDDPDALNRLLLLLEEDNYFPFFADLNELKQLLSFKESAIFDFDHGGIKVKKEILQSDFSVKLESLMYQSMEALEQLMKKSDYQKQDIDVVFLTGGSSQVVAFRNMLEQYFGKDKLVFGDVFTSVSKGLAYYH